ncbi:uncharacterized protein N0V89_010062 [Didymosphaeria variabile]|uniref:F-box domain-containing protein n=1 Tax=Didymosphaeria variabile TaxID=1932322 RepID=A0A9W8XGB1_9PLEO|nr:uncharacterized protein N0V89_010062 [Didymosphaeria variabile]KAJ4348684.1 hypothetical protein N0V89_010062 [Didymosphaeria variabile]
MKRSRENGDHSERPSKVRRIPAVDRLSQLPTELLIRILGCVPVSSLLLCQRLSKKFKRLAVDSELWKAAYYKNFVLPRASRIPGIKDTNATSDQLRYSSKLSKWLDDGHLIEDGRKTNWKQQYRLRHNWAQGQCAVSEIVVAESPPEPPLLVMMSHGTIFAADSISGLRAWSTAHERDLIASIDLSSSTGGPQLPTSMAIDTSDSSSGNERVVVGFDNGVFIVFELWENDRVFKVLFEHAPSTNGALSALAYSSPYLLTMTEDQLLSIYVFLDLANSNALLAAPRLLYSLRSHTVWPPVSLSIRTAATSVTAAIAYALPTYLSGWTVGIQEMRLSLDGKLLESRLATAADQNHHTLSGQRSMSSPSPRSSSPFPSRSREPSLANMPSNSKPTSMSYSHPYLLVAHPDNTLSLYLVKSNASSLSIGPGTRLWGHTSSVSGAHVGMRGKAVSVSRLGNELRVWDLEGGMASSANRKRSRNGELSVRVQPSKGLEASSDTSDEKHKNGLRFALEQRFDDSAISRGWVGFDEQNVIVLREKGEGSQALVVYDFT